LKNTKNKDVYGILRTSGILIKIKKNAWHEIAKCIDIEVDAKKKKLKLN